MSMFKLSKWLCLASVFVLILLWYSKLLHYFFSGHWCNHFLKPWQAVCASAQSILLRFLWSTVMA
jgi:hypothetical protein